MVNDSKHKFPEWQVPLQDIIHESDREKLHDKIQKLEILIFKRLQQLNKDGDARTERQAIYDALLILRNTKRDKLGFPDWM